MKRGGKNLAGKPLSMVKKQFHRSDSFHVIHKVPAGDSPYVKAKRVQLIDKDPNKAIALFWSAINSGDRVDSALKDMAMLMHQLNRNDEGIEATKSFRHLCSQQAQGSLDNVLLELYKRGGRMPEHIELLKRKLRLVETRTKISGSQRGKFYISNEKERSRLLGNLAWNYMQQNDYRAAEELYRKALSIEADKNKQCNLAICLMSTERIKEGKSLLQTVIPSFTERKIADTYIKSFDRAVDLLFLLESQSVLDSNEEMEESYMEVQKSLFSPMNMCPQSRRSSINEDCENLVFDSPFNRRWVEDSDTEPTPLDELPIDTYLEVLESLNSPMNLCLKSQASPIHGNQQNLGFDFLSAHPNTEPNILKQLPFDDFENNEKQQAYGANRFLDQYCSPSLHCSPQGFKTSNEGWQASCC